MSLTNDRWSNRRMHGGFTLVELLVSASLSAVVFGGILAGFTFLGRNLTRMVNTQGQDVSTRRAFSVFSRDISLATEVSNGTDTSLTLKLPAPTSTTKTVSYAYDPVAGTLSRTENSTAAVLLTNLTKLDFNYFNAAGSSIASNPLSVKEVEINFTSAVGDLSSGTQARYTAVSPRLVLRNKSLLSDLP